MTTAVSSGLDEIEFFSKGLFNPLERAFLSEITQKTAKCALLSIAELELPVQFSLDRFHISYISGMNHSLEEMRAHVDYLESLQPGIEVDLIVNKSHGLFLDGLEVLFLNYSGFSTHTEEVLRKSWEAFDERNKNDPDARLLQFCHSKGALHVENALKRAAPKICDRVIVVAIAPVALFPKGCAAEVFSYASKRDPFSYLELFLRSVTDSPEEGISERTKAAWEAQDLITILNPHPEAPLLDHSFQSPTFEEVMREHIKSYLKNEGRSALC